MLVLNPEICLMENMSNTGDFIIRRLSQSIFIYAYETLMYILNEPDGVRQIALGKISDMTMHVRIFLVFRKNLDATTKLMT